MQAVCWEVLEGKQVPEGRFNVIKLPLGQI